MESFCVAFALPLDVMADVEERCPDMPDPLRLERCPDCGYMLCGLPKRGSCPECGFAYDPEMIVLYGWESGLAPQRQRWLRVAQRLLRYWWVAYMGFVIWVWPWVNLTKRPDAWDIALMLLLVAPLFVAGWDAQCDLPVPAPGPVQLRMTPKGFAMREGIGPEELRPWRREMGIGLEEIRDGWFRLYSEFDGTCIPWWPGLEIRSDPVSARRIRQRVARWCREAEPLTG